MNSFYLTDLIGIPVTDAFVKAAIARQVQELVDSIRASKAKRKSSVESKS